MKITKIFTVVLCVVMLSACKDRSENISSPNGESTAVSSDENSSTVTIIPTDSKILRLSENSITEEITLTDEQWREYCGIVNNIVSCEPLEIAVPYQSGGLRVSPGSGEFPDYFYMTKLCDGFNEYVLANDTAYPISDEFDAFIEKIASTPPDKRLIGMSYKCAEPVTDIEYLRAAEGVIEAWLETLKHETGQWRVDSFFIVETPYDAPQITARSEDGKTFAAVVWFDYPDIAGFPPESVFARSSNNMFVHKGEVQSGVYGLFRYENGACKILDYVDVNEFPNGYKFGLGSAASDYETFFEFLADEDYTKELLQDYPYLSHTVGRVLSHNVMRLANGEIYFLAIGPRDSAYYMENGDRVGGPMEQEFYTRTRRDGYNSPIYYDQANRQPKWIEYSPDFKLVFDDYNSDGNPDYAIKVGGDANGTTYYLECMDYIGWPTSSRGEIYVYGRFEDSIRFQIVESGKIAVPVKTDSGVEMRIFGITDKSGTGREGSVDDYRLYSQRYYMPNALNSYSAGTGKIIFNAWNNTDKNAEFGGDFTVERESGNGWETISRGVCETVSVPAYNCGELSVDVSGVFASERSEYRVVMTVNGKRIYGGFYMGGGEVPTVLAISGGEPLPDKRIEMKFTVENTGAATARVISAELYKDDAKIQDVDISSLKNLPSGDVAVLSVRSDSELFSAGEYKLKVYTDGGEFTAVRTLISVPENQRFHLCAVSAEKTSDSVKFTLQNNKYDKSEVTNAEIESICVLKDNSWQSLTLVPAELKTINSILDIPESEPFSLKSGESATFEFIPASEIKAFRELLDALDESCEVEISRGDRLAVAVDIDGKVEWVYFTLS